MPAGNPQAGAAPDTVAIMQPYFLPYAGYFRLFAAADLFVVYDCVQFPRRGWVHRNRLPDAHGRLAWLTLPLAKAPREARIADMRLAPDASTRLDEQLPRFPSLRSPGTQPAARALIQALAPRESALCDYLERVLRACCDALGLPFRVLRSSSLGIDPALRGADRIVAIARALGARRYVNAPGGRALYDAGHFAANGLELRFLTDYPGAPTSILQRLAAEPAEAVAAEIRAAP